MERDPFGRPLERDAEGDAELVLPGLAAPEAEPAAQSRDLPSIDTAAFADAALGSRWTVENDAATLRGIALWSLEHPPATAPDGDDAPGPWRQAFAILDVDATKHPLMMRWEQLGAGDDETITVNPLDAAGARWEAPLALALRYYTEAPWGADREAATLEIGKDESLDVSVGTVARLERFDGDAPPKLRAAASTVEVWHSDAKHEAKDAWLLCDADRTAIARYELGAAITAPLTRAQKRFWRKFELTAWITWIGVVLVTQNAVVFLVGALLAARRLWGIVQRATRRRAARVGG